jgi:hypothetical protein
MAEETGGEIVTDFVQTMNNWRRMCQHMEKICGDLSCDICPLDVCNAIYEDNGNTDYAEIEEKVAAWAAEHPVVYPTWGEYLHTLHNEPSSRELSKPIPDDIAQKLGIEPKEG